MRAGRGVPTTGISRPWHPPVVHAPPSRYHSPVMTHCSMPRNPVVRRSFALTALVPLVALGTALGALTGCSGGAAASLDAAPPAPDGRLFTRLPSSYTGVTFANRLEESRAMNVFTYRNFYNGGGVALGDLTGDGLPEIVLTANQAGPRLYVNRGQFRFTDATDAAGLEAGKDSWTTGVTLADVNGDGRLDIYICKAGPSEPSTRANELWINQGPGTDGMPRFVEKAKEYGNATVSIRRNGG